VLYDAVAILMSAQAAVELASDKPSKDFISDAFAHAKFIAYDSNTRSMLEGVVAGDILDDGCVELSSAQDAQDFIDSCSALRFWDRISVKKTPAV
ncbi:MAG: catalase HPII, partial [Parasphingorhabdus sp.]